MYLWIPRNIDESSIRRSIESERKIVESSKTMPLIEKREIVSMLRQAKLMFRHYPKFVMRFYMDYNKGCPDDVNLDVYNPSHEIDKFAYWYEKKRGGGE